MLIRFFLIENKLEEVVKAFMQIIRMMAISCQTKEEFLDAKDQYKAFVCQETTCKKEGGKIMMRYLGL